jgi:hypothetical protein
MAIFIKPGYENGKKVLEGQLDPNRWFWPSSVSRFTEPEVNDGGRPGYASKHSRQRPFFFGAVQCCGQAAEENKCRLQADACYK